jgi:hypothetical protein
MEDDIRVSISACEEVMASENFSRILQILTIGNVLKSGTKNAESFGFEQSYLPQVM